MISLLSAAGITSESKQVDIARGCAVYDQGVAFMGEEKYEDALKSFKTVVDSCGQIGTQAQALLQSGLIYFRMHRFAEARRIATAITSAPYLETPSAPDGYILAGRIELAESRNFDAALNQFRRVSPDIAPSISTSAEAQYLAGETLRMAHRTEEALRKYQEVTLRYPGTSWKARALIGSASCYVRLGDVISAMEALQRVIRDSPPGAGEPVLALKRNTILHRLEMRGPLQSAQPVMVLAGKYKDGAGFALDANGRVILGYREGLATFSSETGQQVGAPVRLGSGDSSANGVGFAPGGFRALARDHFLVLDKSPAYEFWPGIPQTDGKSEALEILSFVTDWKGEWLISDRKTEAIHRFSAAGDKHLGSFVNNVQARRMILNDIDDLAVVDDRSKGINLYGREGSPAGGIQRRGRGYEWDNAADIAFDGIGNLYVLDGSKAVVHVFDPRLAFKTTIQLASKKETPLRKAFALAVDESGRIFVLDRDGQQVFVYQ